MVLGSITDTETPPVNPPPSSSLSPPMLTPASFYMRARTTPSNYNFSLLRSNTDHHHQYYNYLPGYSIVNPVLHQVSSLNRTENLTGPILNLGSSPSHSENLRSSSNLSSPVLRLGLSPSVTENLASNRNPGIRFGPYQNLWESLRSVPTLGSSSSRDENVNNPFRHFGLSLNHVEALRNQHLQLGSSPNLEENARSHVLQENRGFMSNSNLVENNEDNNRLGSLALGSVEEASDEKVEKLVESIEKNGEEEIDENGTSRIHEKGSGEDSGDGDDDRGRDEEEEEKEMGFLDKDEAEEELSPLKTWNLRPRKQVTKAPKRSNNGGRRKPSKIRPPPTRESKPRPGKRTPGEMAIPVQIRPKFSVGLTKEEIEEDMVKMTGEKPSKKPNKRPRIVQRQLDMSFPGLWLGPTVNAELYRIPDPPLKG